MTLLCVQVAVPLQALTTLSALVESLSQRVPSVPGDLTGQQYETQMKGKFLAMPSLFEPDLQRFLLKEYTPAKPVCVR